jgi:hypothetical protein
MQTFDSGNAVAHTAKTPTPPRTEAVSALHSELEQRRAEAQTMAEYHAGRGRGVAGGRPCRDVGARLAEVAAASTGQF